MVTRSVVLRKPGPLSSSWRRIARIGYGTPLARLGTSPGGDNGSIDFGPSYGTQVPDNTWWYADAAKRRLAHYTDDGTYLGQVVLPAKYLAQGIYFQWQNPQPLADGTVVLTSTTAGSASLLLLSPTQTLRKVKLDRLVNVQLSDGTRLYGFDEAGRKVRVAPKTGTVTTVTKLTGQGGHHFNIRTGPGYLKVNRPGLDLRINLTSADHPGRTVQPAIEVAMGANGKLWILVIGFVEISPDLADTVTGLFSVDPAGALSAVARVRNPTSDSDPADGHHLGLRHGGNRPWLMFIDTDALRVYRKK